MSINVTRSSMPPFEEYCEEIKELWESRWLTNGGAKHREFQDSLEKYLDVPHVTLYTNGHLALENILEAYDFEIGSEVITTPFTFVSTVNSIKRANLTPVFCDIKLDDYTMDPLKIEELITEKTVAIMPVHVYGHICDVDAISKVARKHGLKVIYDGAHVFGVKYRGKSSADFGDATMYSFHATKVFNTIEGGALCYHDDALVARLEAQKNFGISSSDCLYFGGNAKMSEFQAAMGICNLRHLEVEINKRKAVVEEYRRLLSSVAGIKPDQPQDGVDSNYAYFPVLFDNYKYSRDEICDLLYENGIIARKYFWPQIPDFSCYRALEANTPIARDVASKVLTLPLYADLALEDVRLICKLILEGER